MKLTSEQALDLARSFRNISVSLGNYRFENWATLTETERKAIEDAEWTLLNYSSDFITQAVGLILDDAQASLESIKNATAKAKNAVETIKAIQKVLDVAGKVIKLAAAIVTKNLSEIASAVKDVITAVTA